MSTSTTPAAPTGRASSTRPRRGGRWRHHDRGHAAQQRAAHRRRRRRSPPSARRRGRPASSTWPSGAAPCPATATTSAAVGRRRARLQVLPGRLRRRGVPGPRRARPARHRRGRGAFGGLLLVHAEDPVGAVPGAGRDDPPAFAAPRRPPSRPRSSRSSAVVEASRATGCRTHVVHVAAAAALPVVRAAHDAGVPVTAETCPHYLTLTADEVPDGATRVQVLPRRCADEPRRALGRAARRHPRHGGLRPLALPPELKATESGRPGRRLGRDQLAPARAGRHLDRRRPRARPARRGALDGHGAGRPRRPVPQGPDRRGRRRGPVRARPRRVVRRRPARLEHRHPVTPYAGRTLTGVVRQTWLAGRPVDLDAAARAAARTSGAPMSDDFTDQPDLASRALGGRRARQRRAASPRAENLVTPGPAGVRPAGVRAARQGLRRVGDPAPRTARQRPGRRPARGARRGRAAWWSTPRGSRGNFPPGSVDGVDLAGYPSVERLLGAALGPLVPCRR